MIKKIAKATKKTINWITRLSVNREKSHANKAPNVTDKKENVGVSNSSTKHTRAIISHM